MEPSWRDHIEALTRFNRWEADQLRGRPPDYGAALAWLSEAWDLADGYRSPEDRIRHREEHVATLLALRRSLERARIRP